MHLHDSFDNEYNVRTLKISNIHFQQNLGGFTCTKSTICPPYYSGLIDTSIIILSTLRSKCNRILDEPSVYL